MEDRKRNGQRPQRTVGVIRVTLMKMIVVSFTMMINVVVSVI
jgi:hypothetical protein